MNKTLLSLVAIATPLLANAQSETIELTFGTNQIHQVYLEEDNDYYTNISTSGYKFTIDFTFLNASDGLESDEVYTEEDLIPDYSFCVKFGPAWENSNFVSLSYVEHHNEDGTKNIDIQFVTDRDESFHLIGYYDPAEVDYGMMAPEGVEMRPYAMSCFDTFFGDEEFVCNVGVDGDNVYVQYMGYYASYFDNVLVGKKEGNTVTFAADQCLAYGATDSYYFYGVAEDEDYTLTDFVLTYDPATDTYTAQNSFVITLGMSINVWSFDEWLYNVVLKGDNPVAISSIGQDDVRRPAKRFENGRMVVNAQGREYMANGLRLR